MSADPRWTRRTFLTRAALLAAAAQIPFAFGAQALVGPAPALELDLTTDTFNGLMAFVVPGDDAYSVAQGVSRPGRGGVSAGAVAPMMRLFDGVLSASAVGVDRATVPITPGLAALLNRYALAINPAATRGGFLSPLARLSFTEKAQAIAAFEQDPTVGELVPDGNYISSLMVPLAGFEAFSDAPDFDPAAGTLRGRPAGWGICGYDGPAQGHAEFRGYFEGRQVVER